MGKKHVLEGPYYGIRILEIDGELEPYGVKIYLVHGTPENAAGNINTVETVNLSGEQVDQLVELWTKAKEKKK